MELKKDERSRKQARRSGEGFKQGGSGKGGGENEKFNLTTSTAVHEEQRREEGYAETSFEYRIRKDFFQGSGKRVRGRGVGQGGWGKGGR